MSELQYKTIIKSLSSDVGLNRNTILDAEALLGLNKIRNLNPNEVSRTIKNGYESLNNKSYDTLLNRSYVYAPENKFLKMVKTLPPLLVTMMTKTNINLIENSKKYVLEGKPVPFFFYPYVSLQDRLNAGLGPPTLAFEAQMSAIINKIASAGYVHPLLIQENIIICKIRINNGTDIDYRLQMTVVGIPVKTKYSSKIAALFMKLQIATITEQHYLNLYGEFLANKDEIIDMVNDDMKIVLDPLYEEKTGKKAPEIWSEDDISDFYISGYQSKSSVISSTSRSLSSTSYDYDKDRIMISMGWYITYEESYVDILNKLTFSNEIETYGIIDSLSNTLIEKIYLDLTERDFTNNLSCLYKVPKNQAINAPKKHTIVGVTKDAGEVTIKSFTEKEEVFSMVVGAGTLIILRVSNSAIYSDIDMLWWM